jgi:hypothetical protein
LPGLLSRKREGKARYPIKKDETNKKIIGSKAFKAVSTFQGRGRKTETVRKREDENGSDGSDGDDVWGFSIIHTVFLDNSCPS